ncbi:cytochrome d ubiquinol oxidase subunit II [Janibacter sp. DB-40]|uniref:cytochrome d ubiquinol oxidase subunit II n=1 Tax=Janibacter sp. DB-40 TaxID=3028808 RepID=UPI0024051DD3|nr:cytochrome d ubiquinol oxidase subunit II [Janibacter sp. DB-40]
MDLVLIWFVLIAVLWTGYLVLEGFDFGVGMLLPLLGRDRGPGSAPAVPGQRSTSTEDRRRTLLTTIGPHWDGNEVWLLTAGGATFAAFPHWYATMFSGMYLPLLLLLVTLILRNMGLEYRHKRTDATWVRRWDVAIVGGSVIAPFVVGVALTNLVVGMPMSEHFSGETAYTEFSGSVLDLFTPVTLLGGLALTALCLTHGAHFVALKTRGPLRQESRTLARVAGAVAAALSLVLLLALGADRGTVASWVAAGVAVVALVVSIAANTKGAERLAFAGTSTTIAMVVVGYFLMLSPNAINGRDGGPALTLEAAASSSLTLTIMTWAAVVFTPIMLGYTVWSYWIFRRRLSVDHMSRTDTRTEEMVG